MALSDYTKYPPTIDLAKPYKPTLVQRVLIFLSWGFRDTADHFDRENFPRAARLYRRIGCWIHR